MKIMIYTYSLFVALSASGQSLIVLRTNGGRTAIPVMEIARLKYDLSGAQIGGILLVQRKDKSEVRIPITEIKRMQYEESPAAALVPKAQAASAATGYLRIKVFPESWGIRVQYPLDIPGQVHVRVLDLKGKRVRSLENGPVIAGNQNTSWDFSNDKGGKALKGPYILDVSVNGRPVLNKIIIVN